MLETPQNGRTRIRAKNSNPQSNPLKLMPGYKNF